MCKSSLFREMVIEKASIYWAYKMSPLAIQTLRELLDMINEVKEEMLGIWDSRSARPTVVSKNAVNARLLSKLVISLPIYTYWNWSLLHD
jgi:hypothetical protein